MSIQINHPSLAMQAAQRMRKVRHKRKNSRVICHHLKMMLEAREPYLVQNKNERGRLAVDVDVGTKERHHIGQGLPSVKQYAFMLSC
ncbi:MAG: hypothetical protein CBB61_003300 [Gammaproteobacteria bacterium TMED1]|nr:MAG: hypothetical protein CBB61_003300 [Gammaproteobacteria bacterium TMED1]|tara:strand:+ start:83 stop:343 length:261 start_codon:yes stop_codon:yes gene_type:complete